MADPATTSRTSYMDRVKAMLRADPETTITDVAAALGVTRSKAHDLLPNARLRMKIDAGEPLKFRHPRPHALSIRERALAKGRAMVKAGMDRATVAHELRQTYPGCAVKPSDLQLYEACS